MPGSKCWGVGLGGTGGGVICSSPVAGGPRSIGVGGPIRRSDLANVDVVAEDVGVHGGHTLDPSAVEQGHSWPSSDVPALPGVLYQHSQIDDSRGTDSESGHSHAGRVEPSEKSLVAWSLPKLCGEVGHTIEWSRGTGGTGVASRAADQHGQDGLGVRRPRRPENRHLGQRWRRALGP